MTAQQPLLQLSTPIKPGEEPQVVLRLDDNQDVELALALINQVAEKLAPLVAGLVDTVARELQNSMAGATGQLQSAGLGPVPMASPYMAPEVAREQGMQPYQAPPVNQTQAAPVYQPQQQSTQAYAPAPQQHGQPLSGPCWASTRHTADCKDCGAPTVLMVKTIRGDKAVNAHQCTANNQHKLTWCETPIWNSKKVAAQGRGILVDEGLVYG